MDELKIAELFAAAMADWDRLCSRPAPRVLSDEDAANRRPGARDDLPIVDLATLQEAERRAAILATQYSRLSAYLSRRVAGGKHADAVKAQNNVARRVRQALGYTYADDSITF